MNAKSWSPEELEKLMEFLRRRRTSDGAIKALYSFWLENFARRGSPRSFDAVRLKLYSLARGERNGVSLSMTANAGTMAYLDIETTHLKANFGIVLSWAIKPRGRRKVLWDCVKKSELFNGSFDRRVVRSLLGAMRPYSVFVHYYGTNFDMPFIRTKALEFGLEFPGYGEKHMFDLYYLVRQKLSLHSKRLETVTKFLGIPGKTEVEPATWKRAAYGDPEALRYVVTHNIADVRILERAHRKLERYAKGVVRSV